MDAKNNRFYREFSPTRCPTCGMAVSSIFEHVDVSCAPIADAPRTGAVIVALLPNDQRTTIYWADHRSHPGSSSSMGPGWVDEDANLPIDPPEAWSPIDDD